MSFRIRARVGVRNLKRRSGLSFGIENQHLGAHTASWFHPTLNKSFQRTQKSVTGFAISKVAPLCCAAELRRYTALETARLESSDLSPYLEMRSP